ncbi:hypothetical protein WJX72_004781 [[Myrmecia] bisecta]|uniref:Uncharacterized protein n=1 Tax=[Myrmecia] bisecta TaxID=41462 RepID=A0AAW1Q088_9CHLO
MRLQGLGKPRIQLYGQRLDQYGAINLEGDLALTVVRLGYFSGWRGIMDVWQQCLDGKSGCPTCNAAASRGHIGSADLMGLSPGDSLEPLNRYSNARHHNV